MDKQQAKVVQTQVSEVIRVIYAQHGLAVTSMRGTFTDTEFNLSIKALAEDFDSQALTWSRYAAGFGLPPLGVGKVVTLNQKEYQIVGLALNRPTYPVMCRPVGGGPAVYFKAPSIARVLAR